MTNTYKNSPITANDAVKLARLVESNQALLGAAGHYSDTEQYELACLFEEQADKALESYLDLASKIARLADAADEKCANVTIPTIPAEISDIAKKHGVRISMTHIFDSPFVDVRFIFAIDYTDTDRSRFTALVRLGEVPVEFGSDIARDMFHAAFDACVGVTLFDLMEDWMSPSTFAVRAYGWKNYCAPASLTLDDAHALAKRAIDHFELFVDELNELAIGPAPRIRNASYIDAEELEVCTVDYTACADDDDADLSALGREVVAWMRDEDDYWDVCEERSGWTYVSDDADLREWKCERVVRVSCDGIDTGGWYLLNVA